MLRLAIKTQNEDKPVVHDLTEAKITVGHRQDNDFRIKDAYVSAYHAELTRIDADSYEIVDLDSFNGTFINGNRTERGVIKAGDSVRLGTLRGKVLAFKQV
ncbi:MAG: FHA domain-containing protein [Verrucomicrobiales bacterium]